MQVLRQTLKVGEEERLVFLNGRAHRASELIACKARNRGAVKEIPRIQIVVANELIQRSMQLVTSALGDDGNLRPGVLAVFGIVGMGQYIKFADRIHAQQQPADAARCHIVFRRTRELYSIEEEQVLLRPVAGDGKVIGGGGVGNTNAARLLRGEVDHAGVQRQQQIETASIQGKALNLLGANQAGDIGGTGVHNRRVLAHHNLLARRADFQAEVEDGILADNQLNARPHLLAETFF